VRDQALAERVARGEVADFERIENQRAILQRESALVAAERDLAQAAVELSLFVRTDDGTPRIPGVDELPEALPDPAEHDVASGDAERTALSARPDLQRMVLQRSRVEVAEALASNQRLPGLSVQATGSQDLGTGDPKKVDPVFELMLRFDFPLLNRGATGRTAAARAALRRVDAQTQFARDRALVEVRTAMVNMDAARTRVDITAKELEVARALASGELARFELGESTLLLVNLREQASAEAQLRHVDVLAEYHRAQASLRAALAQNASSASTGAAGTGDDG
jgi:outer membrane protein TolC